MATKKNPVIDEEEEFEEVEMNPDFAASYTMAIPEPKKNDKEIRVSVFLPRLDDPGDGGVKVDQYEHVTLANERGENHVRVLRGEHVDVTLPVFYALKEKYPKL